jgi:hypothetical protein
MGTRDRLPDGVYEHAVTEAPPSPPRLQATEGATVEAIKPDQLAAVLAREVASAVRRVFAQVPASGHVELGLELSARVSAAIAEAARRGTTDHDTDAATATTAW